MCSNAIPCPIRWASCDYRLYWLAVNRTFLLQRIEILMLLNWFFRFDLCLWLKLSARVVTWLESREHQIVDVFTGNLRVLSSSRSSRSFTDCLSFYAHLNDYKISQGGESEGSPMQNGGLQSSTSREKLSPASCILSQCLCHPLWSVLADSHIVGCW